MALNGDVARSATLQDLVKDQLSRQPCRVSSRIHSTVHLQFFTKRAEGRTPSFPSPEWSYLRGKPGRLRRRSTTSGNQGDTGRNRHPQLWWLYRRDPKKCGCSRDDLSGNGIAIFPFPPSINQNSNVERRKRSYDLTTYRFNLR